MVQLKQNLGSNVARLRAERDLSKKAFALMSGVSRPFLNNVENGTSDIRLSTLQRFADVLRVEPVELLIVPAESSAVFDDESEID